MYLLESMAYSENRSENSELLGRKIEISSTIREVITATGGDFPYISEIEEKSMRECGWTFTTHRTGLRIEHSVRKVFNEQSLMLCG